MGGNLVEGHAHEHLPLGPVGRDAQQLELHIIKVARAVFVERTIPHDVDEDPEARRQRAHVFGLADMLPLDRAIAIDQGAEGGIFRLFRGRELLDEGRKLGLHFGESALRRRSLGRRPLFLLIVLQQPVHHF